MICYTIYYQPIDDIPDAVGEFMEHIFCRPYRTNPDVRKPCVPAVNYWAIINYPWRDKEGIKLNSPTVSFLSRL